MQPEHSDTNVRKKSLGQHFLHNPHVAQKMVAAANITAEDLVLEIGPGAGFLTQEILKTEARVIAVETDPRMIETLRHTFAKEIDAGRLTLHERDIRHASPDQFGLKDRKYKIVANIPYFLSGFLFRLFLTAEAQPSTLVFLVQKEIAERIARSKKETLLSLSVKAYGTPEYIQTVKAGNFSPPPKVASAVLKVGDISRAHFADLDETFFFEILHLGFASKRKQLLGNLAHRFDRDTLVHTFSTCDIAETARGEDLSFEMWLKLAHTLAVHRK